MIEVVQIKAEKSCDVAHTLFIALDTPGQIELTALQSFLNEFQLENAKIVAGTLPQWFPMLPDADLVVLIGTKTNCSRWPEIESALNCTKNYLRLHLIESGHENQLDVETLCIDACIIPKSNTILSPNTGTHQPEFVLPYPSPLFNLLRCLCALVYQAGFIGFDLQDLKETLSRGKFWNYYFLAGDRNIDRAKFSEKLSCCFPNSHALEAITTLISVSAGIGAPTLDLLEHLFGKIRFNRASETLISAVIPIYLSLPYERRSDRCWVEILHAN